LTRDDAADFNARFAQCITYQHLCIQLIDGRVTVRGRSQEIHEVRNPARVILASEESAQDYLTDKLDYRRLVIVPARPVAVKRALKLFSQLLLIQKQCSQPPTDMRTRLRDVATTIGMAFQILSSRCLRRHY
jgi:signal transduction histidine kinase